MFFGELSVPDPKGPVDVLYVLLTYTPGFLFLSRGECRKNYKVLNFEVMKNKTMTKIKRN